MVDARSQAASIDRHPADLMEVVRGPGIPADSLDDLVDRPGSGLGLRIARQVARAHGGELLGESPGREGHATTFVLTVTR